MLTMGHKSNTHVCKEEILGRARSQEEDAKKSVRSLAQRIGVSTITPWEICNDVLPLFQYKIQLSAIIGSSNSDMLGFCEGVQSPTGGDSWCL
jgi:hypothetical protein